jgi:hypothetical protein
MAVSPGMVTVSSLRAIVEVAVRRQSFTTAGAGVKKNYQLGFWV